MSRATALASDHTTARLAGRASLANKFNGLSSIAVVRSGGEATDICEASTGMLQMTPW
jgi:hypothetical protein